METKTDWTKKLDAYVASKLRLIRAKKGLTQKEVAKVLGISEQQFIKYERGVDRISVARLLILSRELGIDISNFYEGYEQFLSNGTTLNTVSNRDGFEDIVQNLKKIKDAEYKNALNVIIIALGRAKPLEVLT